MTILNMATKDDCSHLKKQFFANYISQTITTDNDDQYSNLNLKQNLKCPPIHSLSKSYNNKSYAAVFDSFDNESLQKKDLIKKRKNVKQDFNLSKYITQNPFEFPRQQNYDKIPAPQVGEFKAAPQQQLPPPNDTNYIVVNNYEPLKGNNNNNPPPPPKQQQQGNPPLSPRPLKNKAAKQPQKKRTPQKQKPQRQNQNRGPPENSGVVSVEPAAESQMGSSQQQQQSSIMQISEQQQSQNLQSIRGGSGRKFLWYQKGGDNSMCKLLILIVFCGIIQNSYCIVCLCTDFFYQSCSSEKV
uniref:Uncharacterized protein n=1 Tax=Panagrolaimus sp. PS1159 TaxID=55785 RepID=A0AC35FT54_9BILA